MDDGRAGRNARETKTYLETLLTGKVEEIAENESGGWDVEIIGIQRYTSELLPDDEGGVQFDYYLLHVERDDEVGFHQEIILMSRLPSNKASGIILTGVYRRPLGGGWVADAEFKGHVLLSDTETWGVRCQEMQNEFANRVLENSLQEFRGLTSTLQTVCFYQKKPLVAARLSEARRILGDLNRTFLNIGEGDAA